MKTFLLFVVSCVLGGFGGAVGSVIGHAGGQRGVWIGGVVGGLLGCIVAAAIARARAWIARSQFGATALGAGIGFVLAAGMASKTLSSPVGPVLSTALIGLGAIIGAYTGRPATRTQ